MTTAIAAPVIPAVMQAVSSEPEYDGIIGWVLQVMEQWGSAGVGVAVLLESVFPPIPSEVVLPGAGFLAWEGRMSAWGAWLAATLAAVIGAWVWYGLGAALGPKRTRTLMGRIPLLDVEDFDKADAFFAKWGAVAVLIGRCVPVVRSFISVPAGIQRMNPFAFTGYTALGSGIWNAIWVGAAFAFGPAIQPVLAQWSDVLSNVVVAVLAIALLWFVLGRLRRQARARRTRTALAASMEAHRAAGASSRAEVQADAVPGDGVPGQAAVATGEHRPR